MNKQISYFILTLLAIAFIPFYGYAEEVYRPPAFEKLYVTPTDVLSTHEGTYYISPEGEYIKVCSINRDCNGPYVILITRQCPTCGRYYSDHSDALDGFSCPIWELKEEPFITTPNF